MLGLSIVYLIGFYVCHIRIWEGGVKQQINEFLAGWNENFWNKRGIHWHCFGEAHRCKYLQLVLNYPKEFTKGIRHDDSQLVNTKETL